MGWSIDLYRSELTEIFKGLEKQYSVQHVDAFNPTVRIMYEGEIPLTVMKFIVGMFPETVYVNFVPDSTFPIGQSIAETH